MNDHDLDRILDTIHHGRADVTDLPRLHERALAVPYEFPRHRGWLPQSPKWRFQSMFSATKFVVAGAIVALFGGFLLAGVVTQQPSDDRPPVGASASATTQAEPTDAATSEPDPTTEIDGDDTTTTPDHLPGVDLVTEEVQPGVYRVLGDGIKSLDRNVWGVAVTGEGRVLVERHRKVDPVQGRGTRDSRILELGRPGVLFENGSGVRDPLVIDAQPDGTVNLHRTSRSDKTTVFVLDGEEFTRETNEAVLACGPQGSGNTMLTDGSCWLSTFDAKGRGLRFGVNPHPLLARVSPTGEETFFTYADAGVEFCCGIGGGPWTGHLLAAGPDGTVWTEYVEHDAGDRFLGLLAYDGTSWSTVRYPVDTDLDAKGLAVVPDGTVWVALGPAPEGAVGATAWVGWDGASWIERDTSVGLPWSLTDLPYTLLDREPHLVDVAFAPDGAVWVADHGLYVITPEAMAGAE